MACTNEYLCPTCRYVFPLSSFAPMGSRGIAALTADLLCPRGCGVACGPKYEVLTRIAEDRVERLTKQVAKLEDENRDLRRQLRGASANVLPEFVPGTGLSQQEFDRALAG